MTDNRTFKFMLADLGFEQVWDEQDGDVLLTFVKPGDNGTTAFIELTAEVAADGTIDAGWRVTINEPQQEEAYAESFTLLGEAIKWVDEGMAEMAAFVRERDEGVDED